MLQATNTKTTDTKPATRYEATLQACELHEALRRVRYAMCKEEARYYLNGVYVHKHEGGLRFVATNGHVLARVTVPVVTRSAGDWRPVILVARVRARCDQSDPQDARRPQASDDPRLWRRK
jgi:DNA polymerase III sliding clamp (beta) subunit (PCNA family)